MLVDVETSLRAISMYFSKKQKPFWETQIAYNLCGEMKKSQPIPRLQCVRCKQKKRPKAFSSSREWEKSQCHGACQFNRNTLQSVEIVWLDIYMRSVMEAIFGWDDWDWLRLIIAVLIIWFGMESDGNFWMLSLETGHQTWLWQRLKLIVWQICCVVFVNSQKIIVEITYPPTHWSWLYQTGKTLRCSFSIIVFVQQTSVSTLHALPQPTGKYIFHWSHQLRRVPIHENNQIPWHNHQITIRSPNFSKIANRNLHTISFGTQSEKRYFDK